MPTCSDFGTFSCLLHYVAKQNLDFAARQEEHDFLALELVLLLLSGAHKTEQVLAYLALAESKEPLADLQTDLRISWKCVLFAARGYSDAWNLAFSTSIGIHHSKYMQVFAERRKRHEEMAHYSPKKPAKSVKDAARRRAS